MQLKKEDICCLTGFLMGILGINLLGNSAWNNQSVLNKYNLGMLSFKEISYDAYFVQVLFLRFRTVIGLWIVSKIVSKKIVVFLFSGVLSALLGGILTLSILENGIWGLLFLVSAVLPQGIFYSTAYFFWRSSNTSYDSNELRKDKWIKNGLICLIILIGCLCEAYISPILMEKVIKI